MQLLSLQLRIEKTLSVISPFSRVLEINKPPGELNREFIKSECSCPLVFTPIRRRLPIHSHTKFRPLARNSVQIVLHRKYKR